MDWMIKLTVFKLWHTQSDIRQRAMVKDYFNLHPGISSSDDWWKYLAAMFGIGKLEPGYLDLERLVH